MFVQPHSAARAITMQNPRRVAREGKVTSMIDLRRQDQGPPGLAVFDFAQ